MAWPRHQLTLLEALQIVPAAHGLFRTAELFKQLDEDEAWRIGISLSEINKYIYKLQRDAEKNADRSNSVDFVLDDNTAWAIGLVESED